MIGDDVFVERFLAASGGALPTRLIASWEQVVGWCEEGYYDDEDPRAGGGARRPDGGD
ncbi:hypothetical protein [Actinoplanes sp. NPDC048796]|uniref:hypothetical protein n=1 Tax=unclassified Actinoplanes TaxID=2626549 RepID=UPI003403AA31